jgi:hypothetical protein
MTALQKTLPYKTDSEYDIINVLKHRHEIPYHSRQFMWTREKYIEVVVREALASWRAGELHWLGFIIIYNGALNPAISDAQHRLTVCFLMIVTLSRLLDAAEPLTWISKYGSTSILGTSVPAADQEVLDTYGWSRYPNIESCYEYDFEALGNILNGLTPREPTESKLYAANDAVRAILTEELTDADDRASFLRFIHNDIKVTRMVITEWQFTLRVFNSLNNIKMSVPPSILLKNVFASTIGMEHSAAIHATFRTWEVAHSRNFEQFIHTMVNLFTRRLMSFDEYERRVTEVPTMADASACPLTAFRGVVERAIAAQERLAAIPFKRLLDMVLASHEATTLCLWPLAYVAGPEEHAEVIRLTRALVSFAIRYRQTFSFNPMSTLAFLRGHDGQSGVIGDLLQGRKTVTQTVDAVIAKLHEWLGDDGCANSIVAGQIATESYSYAAFKRARCMLLYKAELTDSHEAKLDYAAIHIDHIYPKKPSASCAPLADGERRHRLGNLTPFVGKNSGTVKGNAALGNKSFEKKVPEYRKSNIAMTRAVAERYASSGFADVQIEERSTELAAEIAALTATHLELAV